MTERLTAGELSLKAASDPTKYDSLEVGHALCDDVLAQIHLCIEKHKNIINEPQFCIVFVLADDPLIKGVLRRKFYAWPYLPKPRPRQSCFLYKKVDDSIKRLWVLPDAFTMSALSEMINVSKQWKTMQAWSIAFFQGKFFEYIRYEHGIDLLSESEYLDLHREELIKSGCKEVDAIPAEPFDFSKISIKNIVDTQTAVSD